jgi:hypothetical protein
MAPERQLLSRVRMEAGRIGIGSEEKSACGSRESDLPFPLRGKPGREGSPHAAKSAAPPTRGLRPLVHPLKKSAGAGLTGAGLLMEATTATEWSGFLRTTLF